MDWVRTVPLSDLAEKPVFFKKSPKHIALFKVGGTFHAIDNRCPHEGYPLVEGTVDGEGVLTCNWHNWKFRLSDGACLLGGDNVRAYRVEERDGYLWVELTDPPVEEIGEKTLDDLKCAFGKRDYGRICREVTRLHFHDLETLQAVRKAVEWSHDRLEFGSTHAYAASADWVSQSLAYSGDWEKKLTCLAEAVDHMAFDALRQPAFPFGAAVEPWDPQDFLEAVETEKSKRAEGLVVAAFRDGLLWPDLEETFVEAALAHFNDFGHSLIYVQKTGQLIGLLGPEVERFLCLALARHLSYTTREDLIPEFQEYRPALERLQALPGEADGRSLPARDLFPANLARSLDWVAEHAPTYSPTALYGTLLECLALNLLHFDLEYQSAFDRPVSRSVGWLALTHGITFASAVRIVCTKYPRFWKQGLLQMACFLGRNRPFLDLDIDTSPWAVTDRGQFLRETHESLLDHGLRDPIFSAHLLKTTRAVEEELPHATQSCQDALLASLNRFLTGPIKQKHARRLARQAIDLVRREFESPGSAR